MSGLAQRQSGFAVATRGRGLYEITDQIAEAVAAAGFGVGMAHVFCRHTSASLLIQENADPDVQRDLVAYFDRIAPDADPLYIHRAEGPDDMPAHVKTALTQTTLSIPIAGGRMALGVWQGVYLFEHRLAAHKRSILVHVIGA